MDKVKKHNNSESLTTSISPRLNPACQVTHRIHTSPWQEASAKKPVKQIIHQNLDYGPAESVKFAYSKRSVPSSTQLLKV
jgi:hypothetical protein